MSKVEARQGPRTLKTKEFVDRGGILDVGSHTGRPGSGGKTSAATDGMANSTEKFSVCPMHFDLWVNPR